MDSDALMRLLIPEGKVSEVAEVSGLSPSLLYQERRPHGNKFGQTGTRNTIDRLDIFCTLAISHTPEAVRLVGKRYREMYDQSCAVVAQATVADLLAALGNANKEIGEAMSAISTRNSLGVCEVEVTQAKEALEEALRTLAALEGNNHGS